MILPTAYEAAHSGFLHNFLENGESKVMNRPFDVFAKMFNGYCSHIKILLKMSHNLVTGLNFTALAIPFENSKTNNFCICNNHGAIMDISEGFY